MTTRTSETSPKQPLPDRHTESTPESSLPSPIEKARRGPGGGRGKAEPPQESEGGVAVKILGGWVGPLWLRGHGLARAPQGLALLVRSSWLGGLLVPISRRRAAAYFYLLTHDLLVPISRRYITHYENLRYRPTNDIKKVQQIKWLICLNPNCGFVGHDRRIRGGFVAD